MARYHFIGRIRDEDGNVIPSMPVSVYLAGTTNHATVFTAMSGGTGISSAPQITSDINGLFSFYVDNTVHTSAQLFDIHLWHWLDRKKPSSRIISIINNWEEFFFPIILLIFI